MPTVTDIQKRIDALCTERDELSARLPAIEAQIADQWGKDTSKLEAEYGGIHARMKASDMVLKRLEDDLQAAHRADLVSSIQEAGIAAHQASQEANKEAAEVQRLKEAIKQQERTSHAAAQRSVAMGGRFNQLLRDYERMGGSQNEARAIADQAVANLPD